MLVIQITETDAEKDFIVINKPQLFTSFDDPELMEYIIQRIEKDNETMDDWTLEEVIEDIIEEMVDLKVNEKRKRGRPKGSKGKKKNIHFIDENMMED